VANGVSNVAQDTMHTPAHRLAARSTVVAGVTPIIDLARGAKGEAEERSPDLDLQTTTALVARGVGAALQVGIASPAGRARRESAGTRTPKGAVTQR
jgi:hypothetical protein